MAAPGLDEITTTTLRNRKMDKSQGPKKALKEAQAGAPVAEKNFSSSKKETKAAGKEATPAPSPTPVVPSENSYENSHRDFMDDYSAARRKGITRDQYEGSAEDRIADKAGAKRMRDDESTKVDHAPGYKAGVAAYSNKPKASHGYGHPVSNRDGHLRNSGHGGAHRIGKK